jgi:GNAT superfamily N-acetyltransferase
MTCPSRQDRLSSAGAVADEGAAGIGRSDCEGCGATIRSLWPLMPAALGVAREDITAGDVWVATGADGQIAGVIALAPGDAPGALDLNKLFVEPRHIRGGVGRALLAHAVAEARQRGAGNRWPSFLFGRSK